MDLFHWTAPFYDHVIQFSDPAQLLGLLELETRHRLLDVGGGTGRVTSFMTEQVAQACVVDVSSGMLLQARDKGLSACRSPAEQLPFPDEAFDRVLIVDAFHHFRDWPRAALELLRVLNPGGRVVIQEPDIRNRTVKLIALGERLLLMRSRFYTPVDLARLFQSAGGQVMLYENGGGIFWAVVER